jgi:hypothetical protein
MMKKHFTLFVFGLVLFFGIAASQKAFTQTTSSPKKYLETVAKEQHCSIEKADSILKNCGYIYFDTTFYDHGEVPEGPFAKHVFRFSNIGGRAFHLINVTGSCGCMTPEWPKKTIEPNESSAIISNYFTQGILGNFIKVNSVYSNAFNANCILPIRGKVIPYKNYYNRIVAKEQQCSIEKADSILKNCAYILFDSTTINVGDVPEVQEVNVTFKFVNIGAVPLTLQRVSCASGNMTPTWPYETVNRGESKNIIIHCDNNGRPGPFNKQTSIESNAFNKKIAVTLKGRVIPGK